MPSRQLARASARLPALTEHLPRSLRKGEFVGQVSLPAELEDALMETTVPRIRATFKQARRSAGSTEAPRPSVDDFTAFRLDRSYAACYRVLHEITCRLDQFEPTRVLDFGAYLGSGSWAAHAVWPPEDDEAARDGTSRVRTYTAVEPNAQLRTAGAELSAAA